MPCLMDIDTHSKVEEDGLLTVVPMVFCYSRDTAVSKVNPWFEWFETVSCKVTTQL
jgi:hypothetical protein